jgi:hypothetical protein
MNTDKKELKSKKSESGMKESEDPGLILVY